MHGELGRPFQRSDPMIHWPGALGCDGAPVVDVCVPGRMNPGGNIGMPGNENPNPGTAGGTPIALALGPEAESRSRSRSWSPLPLPLPLLWLSSPPLPPAPPPPPLPPPPRSLRRKRSWLYRLDWGPRLPPWSVAMRRLMAVWLFQLVYMQKPHKVESSRPFRFVRTLGRYTGSNLDIRLFNNHSVLDGLAASPAIFCSKEPFAVGFSQPVNGYYADSSMIVTAVSGAKSNSPACLE